MQIGNRKIGSDVSPYIVADLSCSHCGSKDRAFELIKATSAAGADAVKFQRFTPELITLDSSDPHFTIKGGLWDGWKLIDLYRKAATPKEWFPDLYAAARDAGIDAFSTCDTVEDVAFVDALDVNPAFKVGSTCITNLELIEAMAKTGKPVIISTLGASTPEIEAAHRTALTASGSRDLIGLLHCVSYNTTMEDANLGRIRELQGMLQLGEAIGFSDHIRGPEAGIAAVALGAVMIEKHITIGDGTGLDDEFAITPDEFKRYVTAIRQTWASMQSPKIDSAAVYMTLRPSVHAIKDIAEGEPFTRKNIRAINPGGGIDPKHLPELLRCRASTAIVRGTPIDWKMAG